METTSPGHALRSSWAAALMPIVLHELNNATQFLSMLHSVHTQDPESGLFQRSAEDLGSTASTVEDLGLLMAILSTATGTDLLMERRSARGLAVATQITTKLIRKSGRDLRWDEDAPLVAGEGAAQGWEFPWAMAGSLWVAASELEEGACLEPSIFADGWGAATGGCSSMQQHADAVSELLPDVRGEVSGEEWRFSAPPGWIAQNPE